MNVKANVFIVVFLLSLTQDAMGGDDISEEDDFRNKGNSKTSNSQTGPLKTGGDEDKPNGKPSSGMTDTMMDAAAKESDLKLLNSQTEQDRAKDEKYRKMISNQLPPDAAFKGANVMGQLEKNSDTSTSLVTG